MSERRWIGFFDNQSDGAPATKRVVSSDYAKFSGTDAAEGEGVTRISYTLNGVWLDTAPSGQDAYVSFDLPEAGFTSDVGAPMLICEGVFVALPCNATFKGIQIIKADKIELDGNFSIIPKAKPTLETEEQSFVPDSRYYDNDDEYPQVIAQYVGTEYIMGVKSAHIYIYPLKYSPKSGKVKSSHIDRF